MSLPFALIGAIIGEFMAASKGLESGGIAVIFILMLLLIAFNALLNRDYFGGAVLTGGPSSRLGNPPPPLHGCWCSGRLPEGKFI